jgi:glycosyltransferase involved in cell wall biosynthesis
MLRAFKKVLDSGVDAKLLVVGDGEVREKISRLIIDLELKQHVIMTGYQGKPQSYLALMDIYLLSSLSEGTSMTLLEAMSIGKPWVVTDAGGNSEVIEHLVNGLVTANDQADEFSSAITFIANNHLNRQEMADKSISRFKDLFSAKAMVDIFERLYKKQYIHY